MPTVVHDGHMTTTQHTYCSYCGKAIRFANSPDGATYCTCLDEPLDTVATVVHDGHMTTTQHTARQYSISGWTCSCGTDLRGMEAAIKHEDTYNALASMTIDGVPADEHGRILRDAAREMRRQDAERH